MKPLSIHPHFVMSNGLVPVIVCMVLCTFLPDASVLYACTAASVLCIVYRLFHPPLHRPNLILCHGTLALAAASAIKAVGGDTLIPDRAVPITLEFLIFSLSVSYLIVPDLYGKFFSFFRYKISILNYWAAQAIAVLTGIHLLLFCLIYLLFSPLPHTALYVLCHIAPPAVYVLCIVANYVFVKTVSTNHDKMPFLRIAPICNGKIYVAPRGMQSDEPGKLDIPMEDYIYLCKTNTDEYAKEVKKKYRPHIDMEAELRFSLKHIVPAASGHPKTLFLYILPLDNENQIHFAGGRFVAPEEIEADGSKYSTFLNEEISHLHLVAQTWQQFK